MIEFAYSFQKDNVIIYAVTYTVTLTLNHSIKIGQRISQPCSYNILYYRINMEIYCQFIPMV